MNTAKKRRLLKLVGYPLFFSVVFFFFFMINFPVSRFIPLLESRLTQYLDRDVRIADLSMGLGGTLTAVGVSIEGPEIVPEVTEPDDDEAADESTPSAKPPAKRLSYHFDEISIDLGLLALLSDRLDVSIEAQGLGGELFVEYQGPMLSSDKDRKMPRRRQRPPRRARKRPNDPTAEESASEDTPAEDEDEEAQEEGKDALSLRVEAKDIVLSRIHDLRETLPLPVKGNADFTIEFSSATGQFGEASGQLQLRLTKLTLGAKDKPLDLGGMPMTVDPVDIGLLNTEITLTDGSGEVGEFKIKSKDFDANVMGTIELSDPLKRSRVDLYLEFMILPAYQNKSDQAKMIVENLDQFSSKMKRAHRADGYYGFKYKGALSSGRFTPAKNYVPPGRAKAKTADRRKGRRPDSRRDRARSTSRRGKPGNVPNTLGAAATRHGARTAGHRGDVPGQPPLPGSGWTGAPPRSDDRQPPAPITPPEPPGGIEEHQPGHPPEEEPPEAVEEEVVEEAVPEEEPEVEDEGEGEAAESEDEGSPEQDSAATGGNADEGESEDEGAAEESEYE